MSIVIKSKTAQWLLHELGMTAKAAHGRGTLSAIRYLRQVAIVAEDLGSKSKAADWNAKADKLAESRRPIEELIKDRETNHVLINTGAFDWLIAKAMAR